MMQEIIKVVGSTYFKYKSNFTEGLEELDLDDPTEPVPPDPVNQVE